MEGDGRVHEHDGAWVTGANRRIPTVDTVARISRAFGIPFTNLVTEAETKF
jgi:hypothetical protein